MTEQRTDFLIQKFPMGPHLREWFGIKSTDYLGHENPTPSPRQLADFSEAFLRGLEESSPKNSDHFVDILEELVGMNFPLLAIKFVESYPELFPHGDFRAQLHYGNAAMLVGDLARAENAFVIAQGLVPEEPAPYVNLTQIYCHDDLLTKAKEWCIAGLNIDGENTRLWELLAWIEQQAHQALSTEGIGERIAVYAREKNSWTGTSLACDLKNPEDPVAKAAALDAFWNAGVRDDKFLVEYTAVHGVAGQYDKIPQIVWQAKTRSSEKTPWQLLLHLAQAYLGLGHNNDALDTLKKVNQYNDLPQEARVMTQDLMAEIAKGNQ